MLRTSATKFYPVSLLEHTRARLCAETTHDLSPPTLGAAAEPAGPAHGAPQTGTHKRPGSSADARPSKQMRAAEPGNTTPAKKQSRQNIKQRRVREEKIIREGYRATSASAQRRLQSAQPIQTRLDAAKLPAARGAYTALNKPSPPNLCSDSLLEDLKTDGFQYITVDPSPGVKQCV